MTYEEEVDALTEEWTWFFTREPFGCEPMDAEETLLEFGGTLNEYQRAFIVHFIKRWNEMEERHEIKENVKNGVYG